MRAQVNIFLLKFLLYSWGFLKGVPDPFPLRKACCFTGNVRVLPPRAVVPQGQTSYATGWKLDDVTVDPNRLDYGPGTICAGFPPSRALGVEGPSHFYFLASILSEEMEYTGIPWAWGRRGASRGCREPRKQLHTPSHGPLALRGQW